MNKQHLSVVAEIRELEELLVAIPEENVIERMSLEARLQTAKDLLAVKCNRDEWKAERQRLRVERGRG